MADPDELRDKEEKEYWFSRDPIEKFIAYLTENNLADVAELKAIDQKIENLIAEAVEFGTGSPEPGADELYRYIFAED